MDFHKSSGNTIFALVVIVLASIGTVMLIGGLTGDSDVRIHFIFFAAPIGVVAGLVMLIKSLRPMTVRIDERGILIEHKVKKVRVALGWQHVAAVSVTRLRKPKDDRSTATYLTVWPQGGYNPGVPQEWMVQQDGWTGYRLLDVDDIRESEDVLAQVLTRYGAPVLR
ncbi:hypothetical protein E1161_21030 [Saccharopolyspora aridisoli]|uniref:DUF3093 domain-containing protein n=1 Tax=Saccharopolyspora aridisoli TaxID=2530385 RepID=A0A4R4UE81_9PSEU|nr:hypothetical protein [Saccharopolyspora aridisoli]TDC89650.1 hypothetical protein E1161_21030 [Saccharopolyspora aridisoli]